MPDHASRQEADGPSPSGRWMRRVAVFAAVLVAAGLLGRLGSGTNGGPALEVDQSAGHSGLAGGAGGLALSAGGYPGWTTSGQERNRR